MNLLREIVGGPKHRFKQNGYNLDLTYITDRIIAMAFPASGIEKLYRNSIDAVCEFLQQRHSNCHLIVNLSGRNIDEQKLKNVEAYQWQDHTAPPIDTLFIICARMYNYLIKNPKNVVVVHCNHGKGRTGTIICCFLLYCGRLKNAQDCMIYYGKKRFEQQGMGVTQPCQIRYIQYFEKIINQTKISPGVFKIQKVILTGENKVSNPYIKLKQIRTQKVILSSKSNVNLFENVKYQVNHQTLIKLTSQKYFSGDVMLLINNDGMIGDKKIARISFNTAFIPENNKLVFKLPQISPDSLVKSNTFQADFYLTIYLQSICKCPNSIPFNLRCFKCRDRLVNEQQPWRKIYKIVESRKQYISSISKLLLFGEQEDDIDKILKQYREQNKQKQNSKQQKLDNHEKMMKNQ